MSDFADKIYEYVALIPSGRVMTYGQLAALAGAPRAARQVGGVAHFGPDNLPWHRVVNKQGRLAAGFYGGRPVQGELLAGEGIKIDGDFIVGIDNLIWWPPDLTVENEI